MSAPEILCQLRISAGFLEGDVATAVLFLQLVLREARRHCSVAGVSTQMMLKHLVQWLLEVGMLTVTMLADMTDAPAARRSQSP